MSEHLGPGQAHNAVAALVDMYAGIVKDYERAVSLLRSELQQARDGVAQARATAEQERAKSHRPSSVDDGRTACGLPLERFPINRNIQLGDGETCERCTHAVAQVAAARKGKG